MGSAIIHTPSDDKSEQEATKHQKERQEAATEKSGTGLTYKQQMKQDAMLWAQFLYSEYKREKALREEAQNNI